MERQPTRQARGVSHTEYRVIENEYRDYNTLEENRKLREENRLLNEYFEVFERKYRLNRNELDLLREEN